MMIVHTVLKSSSVEHGSFNEHLSQQNNVAETFYTMLSNIEDSAFFFLSICCQFQKRGKFLASLLKRRKKKK